MADAGPPLAARWWAAALLAAAILGLGAGAGSSVPARHHLLRPTSGLGGAVARPPLRVLATAEPRHRPGAHGTTTPAWPPVASTPANPADRRPVLPLPLLLVPCLFVAAAWSWTLRVVFGSQKTRAIPQGILTCAATAAEETDAVQPAGRPLLKARPFIFVRHGETWPLAEGRALSCDGLVEGEPPGDHVLHLSHWQGNRTPERFYADTSTGIALRFVEAVRAGQDEEARVWGARLAPPPGGAPAGLVGEVAADPSAVAPALNNHFDTDGLLSAFVLVQPERALPHAALLEEAAAAGDFDEWPASDTGLKLQFAIEARVEQLLASRGPFRDNGKQDAWLYRNMLAEVAGIVEAMAAGRGEELWGEPFDACREYHRELVNGDVYNALLEHSIEGEMMEVTDLNKPWDYAPRCGLVVHPLGYDGRVFPHAIHRRFFGRGNAEFQGAGVERYLLTYTESREEVDAQMEQLEEPAEHAVSGGAEVTSASSKAEIGASETEEERTEGTDNEGEYDEEEEEIEDDLLYSYVYCRPGHAWAQTKDRLVIPNPSNLDTLADTVSKKTGIPWVRDTDSLTGLIKTAHPTVLPPDEVLLVLLDADLAMNCSFDLWK